MPDFAVMSPEAATTIASVLSILVFALIIELGRFGRETLPVKVKLSRGVHPRVKMAASVLAYLLLFGYVILHLLTFANERSTEFALGVWLEAGVMFLVDAFVLSYFIVAPWRTKRKK